jgi:hypothetical protein
MTTVLTVNLNDLSTQFIQDLRAKFDNKAQIEIRVQEQKQGEGLLSDAQFWNVIDALDWSKKKQTEIIAPAVAMLAAMPIANIYLFKDYVAEKLYQLDTRQHAAAYLAKEEEDFLSADDFLYTRCAVLVEGKEFYKNILAKPSEMPNGISFEPLLDIANEAYTIKTGKELSYFPSFNYETQSNKEA